MNIDNLAVQYAEYDNRVVAYMKSLIKRLEQQYGEIDDEWLPSLDLIAFNYQIIQKCKKDMLQNGIEKEDARGRLSRNPAVAVCNQAQNNLFKLLNSFGLNIMAKTKIKQSGGLEDSDGLDELIS